MYYETVEKLLAFIRKSPTAFHAVDTMKTRLSQEGFQELSEKEYWSLTPGGRPYRNCEYCFSWHVFSGRRICAS